MDKLREMAPWQIIMTAIVILLIVAVGGYFLIRVLTTVKAPEQGQSNIPSDLGKTTGIVDTLKKEFNEPQNLPLVTKPLVTPDPNAPSTVNPFRP